MPILKPKQVTWIMFVLLGIWYFSTMSNWEINYFYKSLIAILPMQIAALIYITYCRWQR